MLLASRYPKQRLFVPANGDAKCEPYIQRIGLPSLLLHWSLCCLHVRFVVLRMSTVCMHGERLP